MSLFKTKSTELFIQGYSCSEAVVRAAHELKMINDNVDIEFMNQIASAFSGGIGDNKCLCGAVAGAVMVLGCIFGRKDKDIPPAVMKSVSKTFIEKFKEKRKVTCCHALVAGLEFSSPERRQHCADIVSEVAELLEEHIKENLHNLQQA